MEETSILNSTAILAKRTPEDRSSGCLLNISDRNFILIAGGSREKTFNDYWSLNISNNNEVSWNEIKPNQNFNFTPRFGIAGVKINKNDTDDSVLIYLHGGQCFFDSKHYADLISLNLNKNNEILNIKSITEYPVNAKTTPLERNSHSIVLNNSGDNFYIFGGGSQSGLLNDLWLFDTNSNKWKKCELSGEEISPREMHGMISYTNKQKEEYIYIFGGRLYEGIDNKMYKINTTNLKSEFVTNIPIPMCSFSFANYKHFIIIYGGTDGITFLNDIIIYNITNQKWAKSKIQINIEFINNDPNLVAFCGRIGSMMSIDYEAEILVIFGGSSLHKDTNYTYVVGLKELIDENNLVPFINL